MQQMAHDRPRASGESYCLALTPAKCFMLYLTHMDRTLKTLMLWFLMALVPLQAGAAAMGMSCGPAHQQRMAEAMPVFMEHREHASDTAHHHDGADASAALADSATSADASDASEHAGHATCSGCSDLCVGAVAPPSSFNSLPAFSGAETIVIAPAPSVAGFVPDGPKRPPRGISA
ncbi:hypothetical protein [Massilia soli]|nr:hypothetical protein [Massilia soli]